MTAYSSVNFSCLNTAIIEVRTESDDVSIEADVSEGPAASIFWVEVF
jgi:hypothetical protein